MESQSGKVSKYILIIKGTAKASSEDRMGEWREEEPDDWMNSIKDDQDEFSDYFREGTWIKDVTGGTLTFKVEDGKLYAITVYESVRRLTNKELVELMDYTVGQWSDGIGEGFEQYPCRVDNGVDYFISPWHTKQKATITQKKVENE